MPALQSGANGDISKPILDEELFVRADKALYQSKQQGRNQVIALAP